MAYAIGVAQPVSLCVETFGTGQLPDEVLDWLVEDHLDLRPGAMLRDLGRRRPLYRQTAVYGHFGRDDLALPWERVDRAEWLRQRAGVGARAPVPRVAVPAK